MPKIRKTDEELTIELNEQIMAFRSSLKSFDDGVLWEAKRIAATIYILCFDGSGRTKSLLGILGIKANMKSLSSFVYRDFPGIKPAFVSPPTPLLMISGEGGRTQFRAAYDYNIRGMGAKILPFSQWWEEEIFHPCTGIKLTRKNVIFSARTQDGGAHVDDHLTDLDYRILRTVGQLGVALSPGKGAPHEPPGNIVWPIIRQIGWELDQSLRAAKL